MKDILKNVKMNFKLNSTVFILAGVIYLFLLVIGFSLSLLIPFLDVLTIIFVISPFIFTFSYLAMKSSDREILEYKDVYKGYKEVLISFSYIFKRLIGPLFFSFLIGVGIYMVLGSIDLITFDREFYQKLTEIYISQDFTQLENVFILYPDTMNRFIICMLIGVCGMLVAFNLFANKKIMSYIFYLKVKRPYINYDFLIKINKNHYKYKTFWLNILFSIFNIIGLVLAVLASSLLSSIIDNSSIIYIISTFIYFFFTILVMPYKYLIYSEIFNNSFQEELFKIKETYNN